MIPSGAVPGPKARSFQVGDIVRLKGGARDSRIGTIWSVGDNGKVVEMYWHEPNALISYAPSNSLVLVERQVEAKLLICWDEMIETIEHMRCVRDELPYVHGRAVALRPALVAAIAEQPALPFTRDRVMQALFHGYTKSIASGPRLLTVEAFAETILGNDLADEIMKLVQQAGGHSREAINAAAIKAMLKVPNNYAHQFMYYFLTELGEEPDVETVEAHNNPK